MLIAVVSICAIYFTVYKNGFVEAKISYATYRIDMTRATPYEPYVIAKMCMLKPDRGPCRAEIRMYYFEPRYQNCSTFHWGGCQGNGNRFDTMQECTLSCLSRPNHPKTRPKWCSLNFDYGFCFGAMKRWYYDPLWKTCKERIYSGCGGNKNNFYNQEQPNRFSSCGLKDSRNMHVLHMYTHKHVATKWSTTVSIGTLEKCDSICRFGIGVMSKAREKSGLKRVVIVNSPNATTRRGRDQGVKKDS